MRLLITALLVIFLSISLNAQDSAEQDQKKAHNFILEDLDGEFVELDELTGEGPLLISFWATWCKPCIEEMRELNKIYEEYKSSGFNMVAISIDSEKTLARVQPFIKSKKYEFTVLLDTNSEVARMYYAQNVPYTLLLDENGTIVYSHLGYRRGDEKEVERLIKSMIGKS